MSPKIVVGMGAFSKIATNGNELLVVSSELENRTPPLAFHIAADLSRVTRTTTLAPREQFWFPKVFWTGDHYVVVDDDRGAGRVTVARLAADGTMTDTTNVSSTGAGYTYAASNGPEILLTFRTDIGGAAGPPKAMLISNSGAEVWPPKPLALGAANQRAPCIAYGAGITLALWYQATGLYATRISPNGDALDRAEFSSRQPERMRRPSSTAAIS